MRHLGVEAMKHPRLRKISVVAVLSFILSTGSLCARGCGKPLHFKDIANHIDRKRYQPWLFYYSSGKQIVSGYL
jgi:hypothetical protein